MLDTTDILKLQLFLVLFGISLMGCERNEEEHEVLSIVNDGVALLEEGEIGKSMRLTTRDFLAQPGKLGRVTASRKLMGFFRGKGRIQILHPEPEIELHDSGDAALVSMPFVVAREGIQVETLASLENDPAAWAKKASDYTTVQNVEVSLVRQKGRWLVRTVRF